MKCSELYQSFGAVDDDILVRSETAAYGPKKPVFTVLAAAAGVILAAGAVFAGIRLFGPDRASAQKPAVSSGAARTEDGVSLPAMEVSLDKDGNGETDMIGFFIYQGRVYSQYDWVSGDADIIGEHLGTAAGLIDEWTPKDGYVELAGSVQGDFYAVKGYDPSFMLCMRQAAGEIELYVCSTGITMKYGAELFRDRLHLAEDIAGIRFETRDSWFNGREEQYRLSGADAELFSVLQEMDSAEFLLLSDIPCESAHVFDELEEYHLYFDKTDGTSVHLRLLRGGYIVFGGITEICVQIPEESYADLTALFENPSETDRLEPSRTETTLEDCRNDPELGAYLPSYVPENLQFQQAQIQYDLEPKTARSTGTKEIRAEYCSAENARIYYSITVTRASEYGKNGWAGPMIDESELTAEAVAAYVQTTNAKGEALKEQRIDIGVFYGEVSVVVSARGLSAEEVYEILRLR